VGSELLLESCQKVKNSNQALNRFVECDQNPIKASRVREREGEEKQHETLINRTNYPQQFYIYWLLIIQMR
jgi:hypothetical protein